VNKSRALAAASEQVAERCTDIVKPRAPIHDLVYPPIPDSFNAAVRTLALRTAAGSPDDLVSRGYARYTSPGAARNITVPERSPKRLQRGPSPRGPKRAG
jgi:hypothetical protein